MSFQCHFIVHEGRFVGGGVELKMLEKEKNSSGKILEQNWNTS